MDVIKMGCFWVFDLYFFNEKCFSFFNVMIDNKMMRFYWNGIVDYIIRFFNVKYVIFCFLMFFI